MLHFTVTPNITQLIGFQRDSSLKMTDTENVTPMNDVKLEETTKLAADNKNGGNWGAECYVLDEYMIKVIIKAKVIGCMCVYLRLCAILPFFPVKTNFETFNAKILCLPVNLDVGKFFFVIYASY